MELTAETERERYYQSVSGTLRGPLSSLQRKIPTVRESVAITQAGKYPRVNTADPPLPPVVAMLPGGPDLAPAGCGNVAGRT